MQFYPSDHMGDSAVRQCSVEARGLWVDMLCVMHGADSHGYLVNQSGKLDSFALGKLTNLTKKTTEKLLSELEKNGVFSRLDDGTIYSRRMLRDQIRREEKVRCGRMGGSPLLNHLDKQNGARELKPQRPYSKFQNPHSRTQASTAEARVASGGIGASKVHVLKDTPQWRAWASYEGKERPTDSRFGWLFPTEWPPGGAPEKIEDNPQEDGGPKWSH